MPTTEATFTIVGDKLPADAAAVQFDATEGLSELYAVEVEFVTKDASFRVDACLRTRVCLLVTTVAGESRYYDGTVDRARFVHVAHETMRFAVRLRPAAAALEHREASRIFQDKSVVQIAQSIFADAGFGEDVVWRTTKRYDPCEFVVQYRESHFDFVSRLFEDAGLFYFFLHSADGHKLVVTDVSSAFGGEDGAHPVSFGMAAGGGAGGAFGGHPLAKFSRTRALRATSVELRDYDFEHPEVPPRATDAADDVWPMPFFEYPGGFVKGSAGNDLANARLRELRGDADTVSGQSTAIGLRVGAPFSVEGAAEDCLNGEFVTTRLTSRGSQSDTAGDPNVSTENSFHGIPAGAPFAAPRRTKKPRIRGVQTATVTGSSPQEQALHVDKYGRIKVRFHWDREGQQDHTSSAWIRVSQVAMGGSMVLPRVGWEVSVAFLDGDPDHPVVLGRVYNAEKTPPLALPAGKASGSLKSMSSPGAGGHNELTMSDSGGSQGFGIHAQKDLNFTIGHDKIVEVGVDEEHTVAINQSHTVKVDDTTEVVGDQALDVGAVLRHKIGGAQKVHVGGNDTTNTTSNYVEKIGGNRTYEVTGRQVTICNGIEQSITGDFKRKVGSLELTCTLGKINDNVLGSRTEKNGALKVQLVNGDHGEKITGDKTQTYAAAELHITKGGLAAQAGGSVTNLVGGLHYEKLDGDYVVKAPMISLVGAVGTLKGGSTNFKLGGGPVTIKGDKIAITGVSVVKLGGSLKMGSG